jgi:hypothetical protein
MTSMPGSRHSENEARFMGALSGHLAGAIRKALSQIQPNSASDFVFLKDAVLHYESDLVLVFLEYFNVFQRIPVHHD